jgi:hypothetical protein
MRDARFGGRLAQDHATPQTERPDCIGSLEYIGVAELIRFLYLGRKSGLVEITHDEERGEILVRDGEALRAAVFRGDNEVTRQLIAMKQMFGWRGGRFRIALCEVQPALAMPKTTAALLTEAFGGVDYAKLRPGSPPPPPQV